MSQERNTQNSKMSIARVNLGRVVEAIRNTGQRGVEELSPDEEYVPGIGGAAHRPDDAEYKDRDVLFDMYVEQDMGKQALAHHFGTTISTITYWLNHHDIVRNDSEYRDHPTPEQLERWYWEDGASLNEIGAMCGVANQTVLTWMDNYGIERRTGCGHKGSGPGAYNPSDERYKEEFHLRRWLVREGLSQREVARRCGVSQTTIHYWAQKFGLSR